MALTFDELRALGDPLVEGPLHAKYLGTKTYRCKLCGEHAWQVLVIRDKRTGQPVNLCHKCYYDDGRRFSWSLHSH